MWRFTRLKEGGAGATPACLDDSALASLLLGESRPLTEDARRNPLSRRFSYTEQDLTVLSWDAALVAEPLVGGLHTMVADTTEAVERVENGLKVTNDVYLARIYQAALTLFREEAWRNGLARKLQIFRDTYAMLNDEAQTARGNMLEVIIILLIVIEVVMGLLRH